MADRPRILMACAHHWTSPFQLAGHHFARAFAASGWDVAFVSNPISPLHVLNGVSPQLRQRFNLWRSGGVQDSTSATWAYVPAALLTPHGAPVLQSRTVHRGWHRLTFPSVVDRLRARGFGSVDVLYFDSVIQSFWLDTIEHRQSVLRVGDLMSGFEGFTREMVAMQRDLARRVDLVIYSAHDLEPGVVALGPRRVAHVPNGVDTGHFQGPLPDEPSELVPIPHPRVVYVGAMEAWFDFAMLDAVSAALPDVSFLLVGPDELARRRLTPRPNVHLLGSRAYQALPSYLRHSDVGLIPFDVRGHPDLVNGVHPLKLYEYLASGLPVVATRWRELESLGSPARLCDSADDFLIAIRAALSEPFDRDTALTFARSADWRGRTELLLGAIAGKDSA